MNDTMVMDLAISTKSRLMSNGVFENGAKSREIFNDSTFCSRTHDSSVCGFVQRITKKPGYCRNAVFPSKLFRRLISDTVHADTVLEMVPKAITVWR
jgi:hypothetical protein